MTNDCRLLREIDAWFSLATDMLATEPAVLRDVMLLVGGASRVEDVASVTAADCEEVSEHMLVYPPAAGGRSLPLTPGFVEGTGLRASDFPERRDDPEGDARALHTAIATVDAAMARLGVVRPTGAGRLRELRMHAWRHELGDHVGVLARCYGRELNDLLDSAGTCPMTRTDRDVAGLVPVQRRVAVAV
jgi:hypothetical protein